MTEKSCVNCYYAHANCADYSLACESEERVCDDYMGIRKIERNMIDKVLEIITETEKNEKKLPTPNAFGFRLAVEQIKQGIEALKEGAQE